MIREQIPGDREAIRCVNRRAFAGDAEVSLIELLMEEGAVIASLVAVEDGAVVGHILFSRVVLETGGRRLPGASLAPVAVLPEYQRRGIGSSLIRRGLELCGERGALFAVVLGHPEYYPRFGFSAETALPLASPYSHAGAAWMALELVPGVLDGAAGTVAYPAAFNKVA